MNIKLTKQQRIRFTSSADIAKIMKQILLRDNKISREREHFWVVGLDAAYYVSYVELISLGTTKATLVDPLEVFSLALQKRLRGIFLVHNHPGKTAYSSADEMLTDQLLQVAKMVNLEVFDHIIISSKTDEFYSFDETGLLDRLRKSIMFTPGYILLQETVKRMKGKGIDIDIIAETTGLSKDYVLSIKPDKKPAKK
jgi:DNA repair protein RadC